MAKLEDSLDWHEKARALHLDGRPFVAGKRRDARADARFEVTNAHTGALVAELADCGAADVDEAVAAAADAFEAGSWAALAPADRGDILKRFADLVERDGETLALLDSLQMGMPISQSAGGIGAAAGILRTAGELADKGTDQLMPSAPGALIMQLRRPRGVVAAITPWNFPVHVALSKIAPALATGNSVILKPSEIAPLACLKLAELGFEAGIPTGVLNALPGRGQETGRLLALHHGVNCLAFVGSTGTGLRLMQYAGQSNMKALMLECGGKSPQIVFDDVGDIAVLADALVQGFAWNSGQVCVSGSRILVADALYDRLMPLLVERVRRARTGDPLMAQTTFGPLASAVQFGRVGAFIGNAASTDVLVAQGQTGGGVHEIAPHLFAATDGGTAIMQEEIFGPVAAVMRFGGEDEAIRLANGTCYGLSATIWSRDFARAHRVAGALRSGFVFANAVATPGASGTRHLAGEPFGMSGFGIDGGALGLLSYTRLQAVMHHLS